MIASIDDLAGAEPVLFFAAVQQHLHGADRQAQGAETEPIEVRRGVPWRLLQESRDAEKCKDADRQIDVEDIAPTVVLGQPAAEYRARERDRPSPRRPTAPSPSPAVPSD